VQRIAYYETLVAATHVKNVLEQAGIACLLRNVALSGGLGDIPFLDCLPEVWIVKDEQAARARSILAELGTSEGGEPWRCAQCSELNEPQYAACWRCGTVADSA
jgi:hypothetical protein